MSHNEGAYKAYAKLQARKSQYKEMQSQARKRGDKEDAADYGDRASVVGECMKILRDEAKLNFMG